jgi:hypothetical protein
MNPHLRILSLAYLEEWYRMLCGIQAILVVFIQVISMLSEGEPAFFAIFVVFALLILLGIGANLGWFGPTI